MKGPPTEGGLFLSGREAGLAKMVMTPPPLADSGLGLTANF
jgi:hypothetical protein